MKTEKWLFDQVPEASTASHSKKSKGKPLFEEEWSKIYPGELAISSYYFPTAAKLRVPTSKIRGIYYRKQDHIPTIGDTKNWGMTFSPCWWACDMQRKWRVNALDAAQRGTTYYDVVIDCGESTMKGFTTAKLRELLNILKRECNPGVVCREGFPWK